MCDWKFYRLFLMQYDAKFLSIAVATVQNFNEIVRKKGHKISNHTFQNGL